MQMLEQGRGPSPYTLPLIQEELMPVPPKTPRSTHKPEKKSVSKNTRLHRQELAMRHLNVLQSYIEITMHYFGSSLKLEGERFDPREEVCMEQQHCGGNTLTVFREKILPGSDFTFISMRHRGYPFRVTIYVNGVLDFRMSTCCEYKHPVGSGLGGPTEHFGIVKIKKSEPCYKCQINNEMKARDEKKKKKKKLKDEDKKYEDEFEPDLDEDDADPEYSDDHESELENEFETPTDKQKEEDVDVQGLPEDFTDKTDVAVEKDKPSTIPEGSENEVEDEPHSVGNYRPVTRMERRYSSSSSGSTNSSRSKSSSSDSDSPRSVKSSRSSSSWSGSEKESDLKKAAPKSLKKRPKSSVDSRRRSKQNDVLNGNVNQSEDDEANGNTKIIDRKSPSPRHYSPECDKSVSEEILANQKTGNDADDANGTSSREGDMGETTLREITREMESILDEKSDDSKKNSDNNSSSDHSSKSSLKSPSPYHSPNESPRSINDSPRSLKYSSMSPKDSPRSPEQATRSYRYSPRSDDDSPRSLHDYTRVSPRQSLDSHKSLIDSLKSPNQSPRSPAHSGRSPIHSSSSSLEQENVDKSHPKPNVHFNDLSTADDSQTENEVGVTDSDMAGGHDPDNIICKKNVSDTPSPPLGSVFEGSLAPLVADKSDVDPTNIKLTSEQVTELCGLIKENDDL